MVCCCELTGGNSENETSRVRSEKLQGEYHEVKVSDFALYLEDYMMDECPTLGYVSDTPFDPKLKVGHGPVTFYAPPPESGGVLCYTLRNFECPSVRPSVCLSVRPSVRPSVSAHHHSCIGNSSYSFRPILLKLYRCFKDGLKICIFFFQNPEIIFYHFFPIFNLDIFRALILQICIWSMYLVSATPPTVCGESF